MLATGNEPHTGQTPCVAQFGDVGGRESGRDVHPKDLQRRHQERGGRRVDACGPRREQRIGLRFQKLGRRMAQPVAQVAAQPGGAFGNAATASHRRSSTSRQRLSRGQLAAGAAGMPWSGCAQARSCSAVGGVVARARAGPPAAHPPARPSGAGNHRSHARGAEAGAGALRADANTRAQCGRWIRGIALSASASICPGSRICCTDGSRGTRPDDVSRPSPASRIRASSHPSSRLPRRSPRRRAR